MLINIQKILLVLILVPVGLTPLFFLDELIGMMNYSNAIFHIGSLKTPLVVKAIKDLFFMLIVMFYLIIIMKRKKIKIFTLLGVLFLVVLICLNSFNGNKLSIIAGIRWIFPFILGFLLIGSIDKTIVKKISIVLAVLFVLSFILQVYQLFTMGEFYGHLRFGVFSYRTTGFYIFPTGVGFFIILCFYTNYYFNDRTILRRVVIYLTPIALIMAYSKTAIVCFVLILLIIKYYGKFRILLVYSILMTLFLLNILFLHNSDAILISLLTRAEVLIKNIEIAGLLFGKFGLSTLTYDMMLSHFQLFGIIEDSVASDSFIATLPINLGLFGMLVFIIAYIFILYKSIQYKNIEFTIFLAIYGLFSLTLSFTEVFPMNLLFSVLLAYFLSEINRRESE